MNSVSLTFVIPIHLFFSHSTCHSNRSNHPCSSLQLCLFFTNSAQHVLTFNSLVGADLDHDGTICDKELTELLKNAGYAKPGYMVRDIIQNLDRDYDKKISFPEFLLVRQSERTIPVGTVCSELPVRHFILSPTSKDLTLLTEQMCVCASSTYVHCKVENSAKRARSRNVEVRWPKWFCVPVLGFSCVQRAFLPSSWYRSEGLSQSLLSWTADFLRCNCNRREFMQRCVQVSWCSCRFVIVVAHKSPLS